MQRGNPRAAKGHIKEFHERAKSDESSHAAMKVLRVLSRRNQTGRETDVATFVTVVAAPIVGRL